MLKVSYSINSKLQIGILIQTEREKEALQELLRKANEGYYRYGKRQYAERIGEETLKPKIV